MTSCREVSSWIETFVDGELPIDRAVDTESHVAGCSNCAERLRLERAFRTSLKRSVQDDSAVELGFRERMARALVAERTGARVYACTPVVPTNQSMSGSLSDVSAPKRSHLQTNRKVAARDTKKTEDVASGNWGALSWRSLLPVAAAAAGAILWAGVQNRAPITPSRTNAADLRLSELDSYLDSMVNRHRSGPVRPQAIHFTHEELLDPPYRLPPFQDMRSWKVPAFSMSNSAANLTLAGLRGASSPYQVRGHRVTFFAYETGTAPLRARLEGHSMKGHVVYVGRRQGYSVATVEEGPVGYAMTSDLPPLESAELIASAVDWRLQQH